MNKKQVGEHKMSKMTYEVSITITDTTSVDAYSAEEAREIAEDIFAENGLIIGNYQIDITDVQEYGGNE